MSWRTYGTAFLSCEMYTGHKDLHGMYSVHHVTGSVSDGSA